MKPEASSWIGIDVAALRANLKALREHLQVPMVMVVKGDAYGHGVETIVPAAEDLVDGFAVFSSHEAGHVREVSDAPLQVMGHVNDWDWVAANDVEPWINDVTEWPLAQAAAKRHGKPLRVHIEIETGMHRTGLTPENALRMMEEAEDIEVVGLCTHLAGAEDARNLERIQGQLAAFAALEDEIRARGWPMPTRHIASSSAALLEPAWRKDMVRVGIAAYGMWPTPEVRLRHPRPEALPLQRVMSWRSHVMAVQDVPAGEFIGYGQHHAASQDTQVAIVPVGYGDGLSRAVSQAGHLLIHGRPCPIVGAVNMNMVQVDVGHLDVAVGDEVVLIGSQGDAHIGIHSFSEAQEVVNYELMVRLSRDIPRRVS